MKRFNLLVSLLIIFMLSIVGYTTGYAAEMTVTDSQGTVLDNGSSAHYTGNSVTVTVSLIKASFRLYVNGNPYSWTPESSMNVILTNPGPNTVIKADNDDGSPAAEKVINFYHDTVYTGGDLSYQSIKMKVTHINDESVKDKYPDKPDIIVDYDGATNKGVDGKQLKEILGLPAGQYNVRGQLMVRVFVKGVPDGNYWTLDDQETLFSYPWEAIAGELIQRQKWATVVPIPYTGSITAAVTATPTPASIQQGTTANVDVSINATGSKSILEGSSSVIDKYKYWASTNESDLLNDSLGEVITSPSNIKNVSSVAPNSTIYVKVRVFDQELADEGITAVSEATATVYIGAILLPNGPPALGIDASPKSVKTGASYTVIDKTTFSSLATKIVEWEVQEEFMPKGSSTWQTIFPKTIIPNPATFYKNYTKTLEGTYRYTITYAKDDSGKSTTGKAYVDVVITADPVVPDNNKPPVAIIDSADTIEAGETLTMSGSRSYDTDPGDYVNEYYWITSVGRPVPYDKSNTSIVLNSLGEVNLSLGVIDTKGAEGNTQKKVTVAAPKPHAVMDVTGTLKENRKVTLSASRSYGNTRYPVYQTSSTWTITPITAGLTAADIKYSGGLTGEVKDVLFKKKGQYKVSLTVYNTFSPSQSASVEQIITIAEDLAPVANFNIPNTTYRNPVSGTKSYVTNEDVEYIIKYFPSKMNKKVRVWFYDDPSITSMANGVICDDRTIERGLGVLTWVSQNYYTFMIGGVVYKPTSVQRTLGWHEFVFDYTSGTKLDAYIDGIFVGTDPGVTSFYAILLGNFWADGNVGAAYFDDVSVDGVDGFYDSFENGFGNWSLIQGTPTTSTTKNHGGNNASVSLTDLSYSPDGDSIQQRIWEYAYDTDNDGMYSDENWITVDSTNKTFVTLVLSTGDVGKYKFRLTVKENLDPATIPAFIIDSDYKRGNTDYKSQSECTVEVLNVAPVADISG
ncbi:MAG: hypothetical protein K0R31_204, partial [Clostridiales bacterium]|nr:hypothetical protein [Clostridiales bacterium]